MRRRLANAHNHMRHHPRLLVRHVLHIPRVVRLHRLPQHPLSDRLPDERSLHSQPLQPQLQSCRSLQLATQRRITDDLKQTISLLLNPLVTHRISVLRNNHHRSSLRTTRNTMQMLISDNSRLTLPNQDRNTVTASHTLFLSLRSPQSNNLRRLRSKILDRRRSNSSSLHQP